MDRVFHVCHYSSLMDGLGMVSSTQAILPLDDWPVFSGVLCAGHRVHFPNPCEDRPLAGGRVLRSGI